MVDAVNWLKISVIGGLVILIVLGGSLACSMYGQTSSIEISLAERPQPAGVIYVGEGVAAPGKYPFTSADTIADIIAAAGGLKNAADASQLRLDVVVPAETEQPQRIDINRAEPWLLEALPGVGAVLSQRIVDYRLQHGRFQTTSEIMGVAGIGTGVYEKIKNMITVSDG